jgi:hypothetical protein
LPNDHQAHYDHPGGDHPPIHPHGQEFRPGKKPFFLDRFGGRFLYVSIAFHVIFALIAIALVVQRINPSRKLTFAAYDKGPAGPKSPQPKVRVSKQKNAMSAPAPMKRITASSASARVALPEMPMTMTNSTVPSTISGAGGMGTAFGPGTMGGGGGGGGGGGTMPFFGLRQANAGALAGAFFDLKQNTSGNQTGMTPQKYAEELTSFIKGGWNINHFTKYFRGPSLLYTNQVFIPDIDAGKGPAAFGLQDKVQPSMWIVLYKGTVTPPESGIYHFVGHGDDILMVRFDGKLVLSANWDNPQFGVVQTKWQPKATYNIAWPTDKTPYPWREGDGLDLKAGTSHQIEVIIGEQPGGRGHAVLCIKKEGVDYRKDSRGNPIFPIFRMGESKLPPLERGETVPETDPNGPIWKGTPSRDFGMGFSGVDVFKR